MICKLREYTILDSLFWEINFILQACNICGTNVERDAEASIDGLILLFPCVSASSIDAAKHKRPRTVGRSRGTVRVVEELPGFSIKATFIVSRLAGCCCTPHLNFIIRYDTSFLGSLRANQSSPFPIFFSLKSKIISDAGDSRLIVIVSVCNSSRLLRYEFVRCRARFVFLYPLFALASQRRKQKCGVPKYL